MVLSTIKDAIKYMVKKPYTRQVPRKDDKYRSENLRGAHILYMDRCTGCSMCQRVCPAACIDMVVVEGDWPRNHRKRFPRIDHSKCTFCALCVEYCPFNALSMTDATGFELFTTDKSRTLKMPQDLKPIGKETLTKQKLLSSYAPSYALKKFVETLEGSRKVSPNG